MMRMHDEVAYKEGVKWQERLSGVEQVKGGQQGKGSVLMDMCVRGAPHSWVLIANVRANKRWGLGAARASWTTCIKSSLLLPSPP